MPAKAAFNFQLTGFPAANRDAEVTLTNTATGQTLKRSPFLDGSLVVRDLDPGLWEAKVTHPNLIQPIFTQKLRLFPQITPTLVPVRIPDVLFQDRPIRDIPDANLGPVQQAVTAARDSLTPVLGKAPGEAIRAGDWNTLASAVRDIADNVLQLTNLVSPRGHDHPEIADKIAEVQQNMRNFSEAFGKSLLELRRELEAEHFRRVLTGVLDEAQAPQATRDDLLGRVGRLERNTAGRPGRVHQPAQQHRLARARRRGRNGGCQPGAGREHAGAEGAGDRPAIHRVRHHDHGRQRAEDLQPHQHRVGRQARHGAAQLSTTRNGALAPWPPRKT